MTTHSSKPKAVKAWAIVSRSGRMYEFGRTRNEAWENLSIRYDSEFESVEFVARKWKLLGYRCIRVTISPL